MSLLDQNFLKEKKGIAFAMVLPFSAVLAMALAVWKPEFFLAVILIVLAGSLFWKRTWMLLALSIATLPFGNVLLIPLGERFSLNMSIAELAVALAFLLTLLEGVSPYRATYFDRIGRDRIFWLLAALVIVSALSFPKALDTKLFFFEWRVVVIGFMAYTAAVLSVDAFPKARWLLGGVAFAVLLFSLQVFWLFFRHGYSLGIFYDRNLLTLPVGAVAYVSAILAFLLPVLFGFFIAERERSRMSWIFLSLCIAGVFALLMMLSKGAVASFAVGMGFFLLKNKVSLLKPVLFSLSGVFLALALFSPFLAGLVERSVHAFVDVNSQYRILEYSLSWDILRDHWLSGVGLGQQPIYFQQIYYPDFINFVNNYALQMWLDLGIAGLAITLGFVLGIFTEAKAVLKESIRLMPEYPIAIGIAAGFIAAACNGLVEVTFFGLSYAIVFWTVAGIFRNIPLWRTSR